MKNETILVIPDIHFPYHHPDLFKFLAKIKKDYQPSRVIQLGDIVDQHGLGKWTPEPDAIDNLSELKEAKKLIQKLAALFPKLDMVLGNHDLRVGKKVKESNIPSVFIKSFREVYDLPKDWKIHSTLVVDGIRFAHGDGFSGRLAAIKMAERIRQSCVIGHVHFDAGILYSVGLNDSIFGMNCGCLIDAEQLAFAYARNINKSPVLGVGLIINGVPHFIPMPSVKY